MVLGNGLKTKNSSKKKKKGDSCVAAAVFVAEQRRVVGVLEDGATGTAAPDTIGAVVAGTPDGQLADEADLEWWLKRERGREEREREGGREGGEGGEEEEEEEENVLNWLVR